MWPFCWGRSAAVERKRRRTVEESRQLLAMAQELIGVSLKDLQAKAVNIDQEIQILKEEAVEAHRGQEHVKARHLVLAVRTKTELYKLVSRRIMDMLRRDQQIQAAWVNQSSLANLSQLKNILRRANAINNNDDALTQLEEADDETDLFSSLADELAQELDNITSTEDFASTPLEEESEPDIMNTLREWAGEPPEAAASMSRATVAYTDPGPTREHGAQEPAYADPGPEVVQEQPASVDHVSDEGTRPETWRRTEEEEDMSEIMDGVLESA